MSHRKNPASIIRGDLKTEVRVRSTARRVRISVVMPVHDQGVPTGEVRVATANLDQAAVDQLVKRLSRTRGGKAARKPGKPKYKSLAEANKRAAEIVKKAMGPTFDREMTDEEFRWDAEMRRG